MLNSIKSTGEKKSVRLQSGSEPVHVNTCSDKQTVLNTQSLGLPSIRNAHLTGNPPSLAGRVESVESPVEQLLAIDSEKLRSIEEELVKIQTSPPEENYRIRLEKVIAKMLELHIKIASEERIQKDGPNGHKSKYAKANKEWGAMQKEMAATGMTFTWIALGVMALQLSSHCRDVQDA